MHRNENFKNKRFSFECPVYLSGCLNDFNAKHMSWTLMANCDTHNPCPRFQFVMRTPTNIHCFVVTTMFFCVVLTRFPFKPRKIIVFCSSLQSQIWIRLLTNSVKWNCEHSFSRWKYTFFIKSPKHPKRYTRHSKENRLFLKFAFRDILVPECS